MGDSMLEDGEMKPYQPIGRPIKNFQLTSFLLKKNAHIIFTNNQLNNMVKETSCGELWDTQLSRNGTIKSCLSQTGLSLNKVNV